LAEANVNPIPIHEPTGLGGTSDLLTITQSSIMSFREWVGSYKKLYLAALDYMGQPRYVTVNGYECFNHLTFIEGQFANLDITDPATMNPVADFFVVLGFTQENMDELWEFNESEGQQKVHHRWKPVHSYLEHDFDFYVSYIRGEMSGVDRIVIEHEITQYDDDIFPDEEDRVAVSMEDYAYDILKEDYYAGLVPNESPDEPTEEWVDSGVPGRLMSSEFRLFYKSSNLTFYDSSGGVVIKDSSVVDAIKSFIYVSLDQGVVMSNLVKTRESRQPLNGTTVITCEEDVDIFYTLLIYDRYYLGDLLEDYSWFDSMTAYPYRAPYYVNLFWDSRDAAIVAEDHVNNDIEMYQLDAGWYWMRTDFESYASPDEIAYLISAFTYIDAYTEEEDFGIIRGMINAVFTVIGAWLFYHGATQSATFFWKMAGAAIIVTTKGLVRDEMQAQFEQQVIANEAAMQDQMDQQKAEAARNNKFDFGELEEFGVAYATPSPYSDNSFLPLSQTPLGFSPFGLGGEYDRYLS